MGRIFYVLLVIFLITFYISYSYENNEDINLKEDFNKTRLLILTKGLYEDGFYSLAYHKAKRYLTKYPNDTKNRDTLLKIMLYSAIKSNNKDLIFDFIDFINNLDTPDQFKDKVYATIIKESIKNDEKLKEILEKIIPYVKDPNLKEKFILALLSIYFQEKNYKKIITYDNIPKDIYLYRLIALYNLGMYKKLIEETENINEFPDELKEKIYYYRALSFYKLGNVDKAISYFEKLKDKNPEILKILISYYLRKNDFAKVKKYLYLLSTNKDYLDFSHYILGYIEDVNKNYDKAFQYYSIAAKYNTKYGRLAKKRIEEIKKSGVIKTFYSVRVSLTSSKENGYNLIKKLKLKNCFLRPYKNFYGVYCGKFNRFKDAQEYLELILSKGYRDALIEEIAELNLKEERKK